MCEDCDQEVAGKSFFDPIIKKIGGGGGGNLGGNVLPEFFWTSFFLDFSVSA